MTSFDLITAAPKSSDYHWLDMQKETCIITVDVINC